MSQLRNMLKLAKGYVESAKRAKELGFNTCYHTALDMADSVIKKIDHELDFEARRQMAIMEQYLKPDPEPEEETNDSMDHSVLAIDPDNNLR